MVKPKPTTLLDCPKCRSVSHVKGIVKGQQGGDDHCGELTLAVAALTISRGFTGHEHLDALGLINMNGRMYDPELGQFLSPDPHVQAPGYSQSFNRYAYCWNNPLAYTDPDGELVWFVPVIIGAVVGGHTGYKIGSAHGAKGWKMAGFIAGGAMIGGLSGYAGATIFQATLNAGIAAGHSGITASSSAGMLSGMASGALSNGSFTALARGNITNILGSIAQGAVVGGFSGAAGAAVFQGANNFFNKTWAGVPPHSILPTNTLSYMAGSTASQMTANLVQGRNLFKDVDYGFNLGMLLPFSVDIARSSNPFRLYMAKKYNTYADREILCSYDIMSSAELAGNGDLNLTIKVDGLAPWGDFVPNDSINDQLFSQIFSGTRPYSWDVKIYPFIRNYAGITQAIYNLSIKRR